MTTPKDSRPRMRDGVIKRGNTWSYVIRVSDASGANRPRWVGGFATENEAKAARDAARVAARRGEYVDRSVVTVDVYMRDWLEAHALEVKPKTLAGYAFNVERYVIPNIGRVRVQDLRPATLSKLYRHLLNHGGHNGAPLSARTVEYVHAVIRKALNDAVYTDQLLATNPAIRAKRPKSLTGVPTWDGWASSQLRAFLAFAEGHRLFALFRLAAYSGARRGELLDVRWPDLDLDYTVPVMRIRRNAVQVDGVRIEGTPKGGRMRTITLDAGTVAALKAHQERQAADAGIAGASWVAGNYVFRQQLGAALHPDTPSRLFHALQKRYQAERDAEIMRLGETERPALPAIRFHDLRHVHATLLLRAGVPVHVVAARLGHADPAITLRIYAHVLADQAIEAADTFAAVVEASPRVSKCVSKPGAVDPRA